jgi:ATP-dependent exoDNAse (exonuclease V) beta subunit
MEKRGRDRRGRAHREVIRSESTLAADRTVISSFSRRRRSASSRAFSGNAVHHLAPGVTLNGIIDLEYKPGTTWSVIDYKSDVGLGTSVPAAYQYQLDQYRKALEACGLAVASTSLLPVSVEAQ